MTELVCLLEEPSAQAMLEGLLPRILPASITVRYIVFEGKQDLDKQLVRRLRCYLVPTAKFVILRDKDGADCHEVKKVLQQKCKEANKQDALIRIACHEIESWYLADLQAVETGIDIKNLAKKQSAAKYRNTDRVANAADELKRLTSGIYQKVGGSRSIGPHLDLSNTRSQSFAVFVSGLRKIFPLQQDSPHSPA